MGKDVLPPTKAVETVQPNKVEVNTNTQQFAYPNYMNQPVQQPVYPTAEQSQSQYPNYYYVPYPPQYDIGYYPYMQMPYPPYDYNYMNYQGMPQQQMQGMTPQFMQQPPLEQKNVELIKPDQKQTEMSQKKLETGQITSTSKSIS